MLSFASIENKSINDSDTMHQTPCKNITSQQVQHNLQPNRERSSFATFQPMEAKQTCQYNSVYEPSTLMEGSNDIYHVQKKPKFDIRPKKFRSPQQVIQQRTIMQIENHNSVSNESIHQQRLQRQQREQFQQSALGIQQTQFQQSFLEMQQAQFQESDLGMQQAQFQESDLGMQQAQLEQQCQELNHCIQQKSMQKMPTAKQSYDGDVYTPRLMEYMCHQRNRPLDNNIAYWRKFVEDYYSPKARKRCCFSLCNDIEDCDPTVRADEATGSWPCTICGSKSGRSGTEAVFENFPSLFQSEFGGGLLDEMLSVDLLHEPRLKGRIIIVDYGRAVLHRICRESRVVHEGLLRVAFTQDLKILSWNFCTRRHEEFVPLRLFKPMVSNVVKVSEYQSLDAVNDSEGNPEQRLEAIYHMLEHIYLIQNTLECPKANKLGIPSTCFQGIEVSYSTDNTGGLTNFDQQYKQEPIASLQNYPQPLPAAELQKQKMHETEVLHSSAQGPFTIFNMLNHSTTMYSGLSEALPVDVSRGGLVGNGLETGHRTPATHESGITMEPGLSWTNCRGPISDNAYQISGNEVQRNRLLHLGPTNTRT